MVFFNLTSRQGALLSGPCNALDLFISDMDILVLAFIVQHVRPHTRCDKVDRRACLGLRCGTNFVGILLKYLDACRWLY